MSHETQNRTIGYSARLGTETRADRKFYSMFLDLILSTRVPQEPVLDVGIGHGLLEHQLRLRGFFFEIVGIDVDLARIAYAKRTAEVAALLADARFLPVASCAIDTIVMAETLEHITNATMCLTEIRRVLKPEGHLFLSTPNFDRRFLESLAITFRLSKGMRDRTHAHEFKSDELTQLLRSVGFRVLRHKVFTLLRTVPILLSNANAITRYLGMHIWIAAKKS
jgi:2-polyprenyl-3-methyl-5-hydroxy-6-metoxy-1,4-benzoquinol methylase